MVSDGSEFFCPEVDMVLILSFVPRNGDDGGLMFGVLNSFTPPSPAAIVAMSVRLD